LAFAQEVRKDIVAELSTDGEECYRLANAHYYIWLARSLLADASAAYPACWV
jgi:hypothetical protein